MDFIINLDCIGLDFSLSPIFILFKFENVFHNFTVESDTIGIYVDSNNPLETFPTTSSNNSDKTHMFGH